MALTAVRNLQLHHQIERVLHVPGNYRGGILEMAIVVDRAYDRETARTLCADIIASCKKQSEVFRNVRLNMVLWGKNEIRTETVAAAYVQMGTFFDGYETESEERTSAKEAADSGQQTTAEEKGHSVIAVMEYLKKFHARSKLILLLTPDREKLYQVSEVDRLRESLSPFLKQKLVLIYPGEMEAGTRYFMQAGINF